MNQQHRIDVEQNKAEHIELLRAQRLFYARAKLRQSSFALLAVTLPIIGVIFGASVPEIRPYLGLGSILVLLLDVGFVARRQREDCKRGARVQEEFDTEVLFLGWNSLVAGRKVDAEEIRSVTATPLSESELKRLTDWYEPVVATVPLPVGRLICQRTNITYDLSVRKRYAGMLLASCAALSVALTVFGLYQGLSANSLILSLYLPALPLIAFLLREHRKQDETIETLTSLKSSVEGFWEKAMNGASTDELNSDSRALQDAIYRHRASNPLVFDWLYDRLRAKNEDVTHHAAAKLVAEAQRRLDKLGAK